MMLSELLGSKLAIYGAIAVVIGVGWFRIQWLSDELKIANENVVKLEQSIQTEKDTLSSVRVDIDRLKQATETVAKTNQDAAKVAATSAKRLNAAVNKADAPDIQAINALLKQKARCAELASGAVKMKDEQNDLCPNF